MVMRAGPTVALGAAADAWAAGDAGGIGGWWQTSSAESPGTSIGFRCNSAGRIFQVFHLAEDLQKNFACLELLAPCAPFDAAAAQLFKA